MTTPFPSCKPENFESLQEVAEWLVVYTNDTRPFVLFSYGTAVVARSIEECTDDRCGLTLKASAARSPDFQVMTMEDGNFLVQFAGPVVGVVLRSVFVAHEREIVHGADEGGRLSGEMFLQPEDSSLPREHYYAGLYARAKLYRDVSDMTILHRHVPPAK